MEQLLDLTNADASKYKDVINIFLKLQGDGGLKGLTDQIDKIFRHEIKFTIDELQRIERSLPDKIDIERQCESNLEVFKTNFQMIIQLLVENSFKAAARDIPEIYQKKLSGKDKEEKSELQNSTRISVSRLLEGTPKNKSNNTTKSTNATKTKSTGKKKTTKEGSKKEITQETSPRMNAKLNSALHRITKGASMSGILTQSTKSFAFTNDSERMRSSQISNFSKRSNYGSPRNGSHSYVESEFNSIVGSGSFYRTKKSIEIGDTGPGPANYEVERASPSNSKIRRSYSPTIGNAKRESWIDQISNTPGPGVGGLYPSHRYVKPR